MPTKTIRILLYMSPEARDGLQEILDDAEDAVTKYAVDYVEGYDEAI